MSRAVLVLCSVGATGAFPWPGLMFFPKDGLVGDVEPVSPDVLSRQVRSKAALVVGGTDGIGRGIALVLAEVGASVTVVGHSPEKAAWVVGNMSAKARYPREQRFSAYTDDLFTVSGCLNLTRRLTAAQTGFDHVVLTVGTWPDRKDPRTSDGLDKVVALDTLARWLVVRELVPLLRPKARVMSVLASTVRVPPPPSTETIKAVISGDDAGRSTATILSSAAVAADTWMQTMAEKHPGLTLIGTWPGVVSTDLLRTYFPKWLYPIVRAAEKLVEISPKECGRIHAQILVSPNAERRPVTYFNVNMEGRRTQPLAYDTAFQNWLWSFLEETLSKHQGPDLRRILV